MQKVVYVLLQQHAERYWQADHDDESDIDIEESYSGKLITLSLFFQSVLTNTTIKTHLVVDTIPLAVEQKEIEDV